MDLLIFQRPTNKKARQCERTGGPETVKGQDLTAFLSERTFLNAYPVLWCCLELFDGLCEP
ncbi:hypothetical protein, partial [Paraburkholderia azotifigens]|uniref:hypothetical protein n=1 Tax=Paraburkholderia azotifigens TaxID=2057004 RepID=UPI0038BDFD11